MGLWLHEAAWSSAVSPNPSFGSFLELLCLPPTSALGGLGLGAKLQKQQLPLSCRGASVAGRERKVPLPLTLHKVWAYDSAFLVIVELCFCKTSLSLQESRQPTAQLSPRGASVAGREGKVPSYLTSHKVSTYDSAFLVSVEPCFSRQHFHYSSTDTPRLSPREVGMRCARLIPFWSIHTPYLSDKRCPLVTPVVSITLSARLSRRTREWTGCCPSTSALRDIGILSRSKGVPTSCSPRQLGAAEIG
jgi:hypothetical protein